MQLTASLSLLLSLLATTTTCLASSDEGPVSRQSSDGTDYVLKKGPLDTPWTSTVGTKPWPEYPRPQLARPDWKNLNGVWRYQNATNGFAELDDPPFGQDLELPVLVPFCLESALSGVMGNWTIHSWYRTTFDVPSTWKAGNRVILNFGAVDYNATVFVNGEQVANNIGGYWSFSVDITDKMSANGTNELVVFVFDPTNLYGYDIPLGKQKLIQEHIFYTPCSGIWQTVWLESVAPEHIDNLFVSADMHGQVNVTVTSSSPNSSTPVTLTLYAPNSTTVVITANSTANTPFTFTIPSPLLWTPSAPNLYNLSVTLGLDTVQSYTGFRSVSRAEVDGHQRPLLNGEFMFQFGTLDQGYWPDGLHSPPSVEAMVFDLKALKEVGFNMVRKHIKVEPALFYYYADSLGLLLIQDMPALPTSHVSEPPAPCPANGAASTSDSTADVPPDWQARFDSELERMVRQLTSHPSIVTWVIYNEGWGQNGTHEIELTARVREIDPTRLIDAVTGWYDHGAGDFSDNHHYSSPQCGTPFYSDPSTPFDPSRIAIQGEFGGIGQNVSIEHAWDVPLSLSLVKQTYELDADVATWNWRAHEIFTQLQAQIETWGACSAAVWTQTTDVEGEVNGLLTYDRRVNRMDKGQWMKDIQGLYDAARGVGGGGNATQQEREGLGMVGRGQMALGTGGG